MTTYQDPPQSRRSARQTERGEEAGTPAGYPQFMPEGSSATPPTTQYPSFAQQPMQPPVQQPVQPPAAPAASSGRRSAQQPGYSEPLSAEPLNYSTQGNPGAYVPAPQQSFTEPMPSDDTAAYRVRDFSPEGRSSGRRSATPPPLIEPQSYSQQGYQQPAGEQAPSYSYGQQPAVDLDYRTQARSTEAYQQAPEQHHTLSRRELRQQQDEQNAANQAYVTGNIPPVNSPFLTNPGQQYAPQQAQAQAPQAPQPQAPQPQAYAQPAPPAVPAPQPPTALSNAMAEFEALTRNGQPAPPAPSSRVVVEEIQQPRVSTRSGSFIAPVGHWSRQADMDDQTQPWENTITREVGGGNVATTTNALVLPEMPRPNPFPTAFNSTGEILLTGSIDLPRSLGSTGGDARRLDDPNVDYMFENQDRDYPATDSSPVRAVRAVSTRAPSRGVMAGTKPHGNRMLTVLLVVSAVMAVGVGALLVAAIGFNLF